ncbi:hypothetical protein SPHINGO391_510178 [Sphingomonas aurantiaca]|mgnify:CR=1 FL=1|uniref:Uncharacterized protein n=1 Tax=Sphingomonas aurantiaca TaxID=185949 RepID=A0A5E8AEG2_9SPHN|nr:hypothetical protein SPHINGO391_510178 [Sphingomonas aurantiaca]
MPHDIDGFIREINEHVWLPAYDLPVLLKFMARRRAPGAASAREAWLTIYVDDLQSRPLAEDIARIGWP